MALKGDGKAALIALPGEKEVRLGGTFMVVSGRHRTVVGGGAACYEDSELERRNDIGSPGSPPSVGQPDTAPDHHCYGSGSDSQCHSLGLLRYALIGFPTFANPLLF